MLMALLAAFVLGVVAGMRTFTAPAVYFLSRGGTVSVALILLAAGEWVGDLLPNVPSRTSPPALLARLVSGGVVGGFVFTARHEPVWIGAVAGIVGALVGAFGGRTVRLKAITRIGAIPSALLEDATALALACLAVFVLLH